MGGWGVRWLSGGGGGGGGGCVGSLDECECLAEEGDNNHYTSDR